MRGFGSVGFGNIIFVMRRIIARILPIAGLIRSGMDWWPSLRIGRFHPSIASGGRVGLRGRVGFHPTLLIDFYRTNFLCFIRLGSSASAPSLRFLSSS